MSSYNSNLHVVKRKASSRSSRGSSKPPRRGRFGTGRTLKVFAVVGVTALITYAVVTSPLFHITEVVISGNSQYTITQIKDAAGFMDSENASIFSQSSANIKKRIESLPYIKNVSVKKSYPGTVLIDVTERVTRAYVEYKNYGQYLYIDETGVVTDVKPFCEQPLPIIVGLSFSGFELGERLVTDSGTPFDDTILIAALFDKYELSGDAKVDVSDPNDIHIYINHIDIEIGTIDDADEKIRIAKAALDNLDKNLRGTLTVKDINGDWIFKMLR